MFNYIGILGLLILVMVLTFFFGISISIEKKTIKRLFEREKERIRIFNKLLALEERIAKKTSKDIKRDSLQEKYLGQIRYIINNYGYNIEKVEIGTIKSKRRNSQTSLITRESFFDAFLNSSKPVKRDILDLSEILDSIYKFNHPVKYKFVQFKKNISVQILLFLLKLCLNVLKLLEKLVQRKEKKQRLNIYANEKIQEKRVSNSLIVNDYSNTSIEEIFVY